MARKRGHIPQTWSTLVNHLSLFGRRNILEPVRQFRARRPSPSVNGLVAICPGGRHAVFGSSAGPLRKPVAEAVGNCAVRERLQRTVGMPEDQLLDAVSAAIGGGGGETGT